MFRKLLPGIVVILLGTLGCAGLAQEGSRQPGQDPRQFGTPRELLEAAQPAWQPTGPTEQFMGVSFQRPTGWESTAADDWTMIASPPDEYGDRCVIFVLEPRPVATTDPGRLEQALQVASDLLLEGGDELTGVYGDPEPLRRSFRGSSGNGWDYAGLTLRLSDAEYDTFDVISMLAYSDSSAVPVVVIGAGGSTSRCVGYDGEFGLDVANVFHSLEIGSAQTDQSLAEGLIGKWFSSSGSVGNYYLFGANEQYMHVSVLGGWVETFPDQWESRYATWLGDGSWTAAGSVMAMFPNDRPATSYFTRLFEFRDYEGEWHDTLCWVDVYEGEPYNYCTRRNE